MPRLTSTYMLCVALAGLALSVACSDDENGPSNPVDARPDVMAACVPADCQPLALPPTRCSNGSIPSYDCVRNGFTGRCERVNARCATTDAGSVEAGATSDGAASDAGPDAPAEETGEDAGDDGPPADTGEDVPTAPVG